MRIAHKIVVGKIEGNGRDLSEELTKMGG